MHLLSFKYFHLLERVTDIKNEFLWYISLHTSW